MARDFIIPAKVQAILYPPNEDGDFKRAGKFVSHARKKESHRGISKLKDVSYLEAAGVNDAFFDEICAMDSLEYLDLDTVTVEDLTPLQKLKNLKALSLDSVRKASEFRFLHEMTHLHVIGVTNGMSNKWV